MDIRLFIKMSVLIAGLYASSVIADTQKIRWFKATAQPTKPQPQKNTTIHANNSIFDLELWGQINQLVWNAYDGDHNTRFYGNNNNSDTRFGIHATTKATPDITLFGDLAVDLLNNSSNIVSQITQTNTTFKIRIADLGVDTPIGKFSLGQGDTASEGSAEVDLSGTSMAGHSARQKLGGGVFFRNALTDDLSTIQVANTLDNLDGLSRKSRFRYDTPTYIGLKLSGSVMEENQSDVALRFEQEYSDVKVAAAIACANSTVIRKQVPGHAIDGSLSVLLKMGLNATVAGGQLDARESDRDNPHYYYGKLGYQQEFVPVGITAFSVDYAQFRHYYANDDTAKTFGLDVVQHFTQCRTQVFAGYHRVSLAQEDVSYHPINIVFAGALIKF